MRQRSPSTRGLSIASAAQLRSVPVSSRFWMSIDRCRRASRAGRFASSRPTTTCPADDLTLLLGIKKRTLQRREKEARLPPGESDRLWRADVILREATEVLGSRGKAASWLHRENRALGGSRPLDMIATEAGYEEVRSVLGRIEWGVWS